MQKVKHTLNPTKLLPNNIGLAGVELEVAKSQLCGAKSVSKLYDFLRNQGTDHDTAIALVNARLGVSVDFVKSYVMIYKSYQASSNPTHINFEYYFLYTVGLKKLYAFLPVLKEFYRKNDLVSRRVVMTPKSIELYVLVDQNKFGWVHLADLPLEQLINFMSELRREGNSSNAKDPMPSTKIPNLTGHNRVQKAIADQSTTRFTENGAFNDTLNVMQPWMQTESSSDPWS